MSYGPNWYTPKFSTKNNILPLPVHELNLRLFEILVYKKNIHVYKCMY